MTNVSPDNDRPRGKRHVAKRIAFHGVSWFVLLPILLFLAFYVTLLITPVRLPFVAEQVRSIATESLGENLHIEMGDTYLALEKGAPVLRFAPVTLTDNATLGAVTLEAIEIGFSPINALRGQPGAVISLVKPELQIIQDLLGPRLARFELEEATDGGRPILRVLAGRQTMPSVGITAEGLDVRDTSAEIPTVEFRSDHDWLVLNLLAGEAGLRDVSENAQNGLFSRLFIRDAEVEMLDSVYGLVRKFSNMDFELDADSDTGDVSGVFKVDIAGQTMTGTVERHEEDDGRVMMVSNLENANLSAVAPFMDDPDAMTAIKGTSDVESRIWFEDVDGETRTLGGEFKIDLSGMELRLQHDYYPIHSAVFNADWDASQARFTMHDGEIKIAESSAIVSSVIVMGLDPTFGPTVRISSSAKDIFIHPRDMAAPTETFDEAFFIGWSAPLYSTLGIDKMVLRRGDMQMVAEGRADMLAVGPGIDLDVNLANATADDLKRLWPYVMGTPAREWFVEQIQDGSVKNAQIKFDFPAGSMAEADEEWVWPENSMSVEMVAENVLFRPTPTFDPILATGETKLSMRDADINIEFGDATVSTAAGAVNLRETGFSWLPDERYISSRFAIAGKIDAPVGALVELLEKHATDQLAAVDMPIALSSLQGQIDAEIDASFVLSGEENTLEEASYDVEGRVLDFASSEKLMDRTLSDGQFSFSVDDNGYRVNGPTSIDGLVATLDMSGTLEENATPKVALTAKFDADDLKEFGFDVSEFLGGTVEFRGEPNDDGTIDVSIDLSDASLEVADIGLSKARGTAGELTATIGFDGKAVDITSIDLGFGKVSLQGGVQFHQDNGLVSADFSKFTLSEGDDARLSVRPDGDGFGLTIRGAQLDLKPLLGRFFSLDGGSGGPTANAVDQTVVLDAKLDRALGFYSTTAFNMEANLELRGSDLRNVAVQANFGSGNALSVTTNRISGGKVVSVAFNGLGQMLRFTGTYSQLVGGTGSLVLTTRNSESADFGELTIRNFSIVNEGNVAQVLGNHADSRSLIASANRMDIESGKASFIRRADRIEITNAVVDGGSIGGTARGFIYTGAGQYDISGTYIPLFGLNNAFQQLPILGRLLGGRDGEGLIGVTFAVRGPLDKPEFLVNPASLLVPGAFRSLFEFRSNERPAANN